MLRVFKEVNIERKLIEPLIEILCENHVAQMHICGNSICLFANDRFIGENAPIPFVSVYYFPLDFPRQNTAQKVSQVDENSVTLCQRCLG